MNYNKKTITLEHIIQYFEIDIDNCLLTKKDFAKHIHALITNPEKEISNWENEIEEYYNERELDAWRVVYHVKTENGFMIKVDDGYGYDEVHDINDPRVAVFNHSHEARDFCDFHDEVVMDSNGKNLEQTGTYECADCFRLSRHPDDEVDDCDTCDNTGEVKF